MADAIDHAQAREQLDRELMLAAHHQRVARDSSGAVSVDGLCSDCDQPIEVKRLEVLRVTSRCASCAQDYERRMAMQGRRT